MLISLDRLPDDRAELKEIIADLAKENQSLHTKQRTELEAEYRAEIEAQRKHRCELEAEYQAEIERLKEQIWILLHRQFSPSSEAAPGQHTLFDEAEVQSAVEPEIEVPAHRRRKRAGRRALPESLPRVDIVHELAEEQRSCPHDGTRLEEIGEEVSEQLDYIPARLQVIRHVRKKYACRTCEAHVARAALPAQMIPKSLASAGLLAQVAIAKYQDALPLYRQEQIFARLGVDLDRTLLASWMVRVGERLEALSAQMRSDLLAAAVVHSDETTVQVLREPGRGAQQKSYMWVQATATGPPIVLYHYAPGRGQNVVQALLGAYRGTLVTDGYAAYGVLSGARHAGCWAHARRRFDEALKAQSGKGSSGRAQVGFTYIQKLFALERKFRTLEPEQRHERRQVQSKPVVDELRQWLAGSLPEVAPKTLIGKALSYLDNQWDKLVVFLEDGEVALSNNLVENKIRPFVIGRKNFLFSNSVAGAKSSARIYSVIETAKASGLDPHLYLRWLFAELPKIDVDDPAALGALLPYRCDRERIVDAVSQQYLAR